MESWTETRFAEDQKTCLNFLDQAKALLKSSKDEGDKQNLEFLISELTIFTDGHIHGGYYFPLNYMEGLHVDFQRLAEWATPSTVKEKWAMGLITLLLIGQHKTILCWETVSICC